jgi:hypothetical protein
VAKAETGNALATRKASISRKFFKVHELPFCRSRIAARTLSPSAGSGYVGQPGLLDGIDFAMSVPCAFRQFARALEAEDKSASVNLRRLRSSVRCDVVDGRLCLTIGPSQSDDRRFR